jgi:hypothetical protein
MKPSHATGFDPPFCIVVFRVWLVMFMSCLIATSCYTSLVTSSIAFFLFLHEIDFCSMFASSMISLYSLVPMKESKGVYSVSALKKVAHISKI